MNKKQRSIKAVVTQLLEIGICTFLHCQGISIDFSVSSPKLNANQPHLCDYLTHRQTPWTDNDSSLLFAVLGRPEPLLLTAAHQKFDLDL